MSNVTGRTTTIRVSRHTHELLNKLASQDGRTVTALIDQLAENARRDRVAAQHVAAMQRLLANPEERAAYEDELAISESLGAETLCDEPPFPRQ